MNYYQVLGIKVTATTAEIRTAYRLMAKKYHPDLNKKADPKKMIEINQAYETLLDPEKRKLYDLRENLGKSRTSSGFNYSRTYYDESNNPFGFDSSMNDIWEEMMRNMRQEVKTEWKEQQWKRQKLSIAKIKRLLKTDLQERKEYESYSETQCDLCSNPIHLGDIFYFIADRQKMCKECRKDIISHL